MELPPSLVDGEVCWKRPADLYEVGVATTSCRTGGGGGGDDFAVSATYLFIMFAVLCCQTVGVYNILLLIVVWQCCFTLAADSSDCREA